MKKGFKPATAMVGLPMLTLLISSCSVSKVAQCNSMIKVSNEAAQVGKSFATIKDMKSDAEKISFLKTAASKLATQSTAMKALEINDEKLKGFKTRFTEMYDGTGTGISEAATAMEKSDRTAFMSAVSKMQTSGSGENALVSETNSYCSGK
jgi:hypothetical protein